MSSLHTAQAKAVLGTVAVVLGGAVVGVVVALEQLQARRQAM